jgi:hypothetical protein
MAREEVAMAEEKIENGPESPLVVYSHVTPWGFLVSLPLAIVLVYLGAWGLDIGLVSDTVGRAPDEPLWIFSVPLLGFALFLFLIGVGELASYLKPGVEVVVDGDGVSTFGVLGRRFMAWGDIFEARLGQGQLSLRGRGKSQGAVRDMRLHFGRLAIPPAVLVGRIAARRSDLDLPAAEREAADVA